MGDYYGSKGYKWGITMKVGGTNGELLWNQRVQIRDYYGSRRYKWEIIMGVKGTNGGYYGSRGYKWGIIMGVEGTNGGLLWEQKVQMGDYYGSRGYKWEIIMRVESTNGGCLKTLKSKYKLLLCTCIFSGCRRHRRPRRMTCCYSEWTTREL